MPVLGLRTDELPAFYCRTSGYKLDYNCQDEETVAKIMKTKWDVGLKGGAVVGNPIPEQYAMDPDYMNGIIEKAVAQANAEHIHGKAITPFLLAHIKDMTGGSSFAANLELAYNNARLQASPGGTFLRGFLCFGRGSVSGLSPNCIRIVTRCF